jgi:hypothetical protein
MPAAIPFDNKKQRSLSNKIAPEKTLSVWPALPTTPIT